MRVHPVAVAAFSASSENHREPARAKLATIRKMAMDTALVTHSNKLGYDGAVLQVP